MWLMRQTITSRVEQWPWPSACTMSTSKPHSNLIISNCAPHNGSLRTRQIMNEDQNSNPFDQDEPANSLSAFDQSGMSPLEDGSNNRRLIWILAGIILLGCGFIFVAAFFFFQPDAKPLIAQYFPSATATPTKTLTPT